MLCRRARKIPAERSTDARDAGLGSEGFPWLLYRIWALAVSLSLQQPRLARVGTAAQQGLNSRRAPSTRAQHLSSALPPQLWDPRIPSSARGNSGQKRGTQSVGGTFPVPVNKNKPSKGLVIGIQATQKAGTSKLEYIPNISLEVQLTECFQ